MTKESVFIEHEAEFTVSREGYAVAQDEEANKVSYRYERRFKCLL